MEKARTEKNKNYYLEGIKLLLRPDESVDKISQIHQEYIEAYNTRKAIIDNLYSEIKEIKKLKV